MPIIKYRIHSRGRPRQIDTDALYEQIEDLFYKAEPRLAKFRKETKGYRGEALLGTSTTAPDWVSESLDILLASDGGRPISKTEIQEILQTRKSLRELSSPQARVYERALSEQLTTLYIKDVQKGMQKEHTLFREQQIQTIKDTLSRMSPRERQEYIVSKYYQDPRTQYKNYKRVLDWTQYDMEKEGFDKELYSNVTFDEAWAYVNKRRLEDFQSKAWD